MHNVEGPDGPELGEELAEFFLVTAGGELADVNRPFGLVVPGEELPVKVLPGDLHLLWALQLDAVVPMVCVHLREMSVSLAIARWTGK